MNNQSSKEQIFLNKLARAIRMRSLSQIEALINHYSDWINHEQIIANHLNPAVNRGVSEMGLTYLDCQWYWNNVVENEQYAKL